MKAIFLGKHMVRKKFKEVGFFGNPYDDYRNIFLSWDKFYECEIGSLEFKEDSTVNVNGNEIEIQQVIYELDGSITYKTSHQIDVKLGEEDEK